MSPQGTILIIEDNEDHLELFRDAFEPEYEVFSAENGEECLEIVAEGKCDLVILDYYLSSLFSGIEVLKKISQNYPNLPVIMVTAYGNEELAVEAMKYGARDYIRKTLDNSYIDRIREHAKNILTGGNTETQPDSTSKIPLEKGMALPLDELTYKYCEQTVSFFEENKDRFFEEWKNRIHVLSRKVGISTPFSVDVEEMTPLFVAFLHDIHHGCSSETVSILIQMVLHQKGDEKTLLLAELLNTAFRDVARNMFHEMYPEAFSKRSKIMMLVGDIVDHNHLELICEYERIIAIGPSRARQSERLATKSMLMATLQHEIRQPLTFILNTAELLQIHHPSVNDEMIKTLLQQTRRIEALLDRLERDSHIHARRYSADLTMIDVREDKGGENKPENASV